CSMVQSLPLSLVFYLWPPPPPTSTLFPYTTLFRSPTPTPEPPKPVTLNNGINDFIWSGMNEVYLWQDDVANLSDSKFSTQDQYRSEEHTSELQSRENLVCRLLLEKKKKHSNSQARC